MSVVFYSIFLLSGNFPVFVLLRHLLLRGVMLIISGISRVFGDLRRNGFICPFLVSLSMVLKKGLP